MDIHAAIDIKVNLTSDKVAKTHNLSVSKYQISMNNSSAMNVQFNHASLVSQVHYVAKWKGITFMTSRQGLGVGGGTVRLDWCCYLLVYIVRQVIDSSFSCCHCNTGVVQFYVHRI